MDEYRKSDKGFISLNITCFNILNSETQTKKKSF